MPLAGRYAYARSPSPAPSPSAHAERSSRGRTQETPGCALDNHSQYVMESSSGSVDYGEALWTMHSPPPPASRFLPSASSQPAAPAARMLYNTSNTSPPSPEAHHQQARQIHSDGEMPKRKRTWMTPEKQDLVMVGVLLAACWACYMSYNAGKQAGTRNVLNEQKAIVIHAAFEEVEAQLALFKSAVLHGQHPLYLQVSQVAITLYPVTSNVCNLRAGVKMQVAPLFLPFFLFVGIYKIHQLCIHREISELP